MKRTEYRFGVNDIQPFGKTVTFERPVLGTVVVEDRFLVLFDYMHDREGRGRNIKAYDRHGKLLWEIEPSGGFDTMKNGTRVPEPYVALSIGGDDGPIRAHTFNGDVFDVDLDTGERSNFRWLK